MCLVIYSEINITIIQKLFLERRKQKKTDVVELDTLVVVRIQMCGTARVLSLFINIYRRLPLVFYPVFKLKKSLYYALMHAAAAAATGGI